MLEGSMVLWDEIARQLEEIDKQQARLQVQSYLADRYSRCCCELFAQLDSKRSELEQLIQEWEEATGLYGPQRGTR